MDCTVNLWDSGFGSVTDTSITLEARSAASVLASMNNGTLSAGGGSGAILSFTSSKITFAVEVDTWGTVYAPWIVHELNGDRSTQEISVVLLATPATSSYSPPSTANEVDGFISEQNWREEEKMAVTATIDTLTFVGRSSPVNRSNRLIRTASSILTRLRIEPGFFLKAIGP